MFKRKHVAAVSAEFLGTATLAFVVLTVSRSTIGIPYFVAFAAGLALMLMVASFNVHLNPALTLGLWTARRVGTVKAVAFLAAQLLGGFAAYGLYKYFAHGTVQSLGGEYEARVLVAEAAGAFVFTFAAARVLFTQTSAYARAAVVGGALTLGIIVASVAANGFINPAVALASNSWEWGTYVLGPVLGGVIGINLYGLLFADKEALVAKATAKVSKAKAKK